MAVMECVTLDRPRQLREYVVDLCMLCRAGGGGTIPAELGWGGLCYEVSCYPGSVSAVFCFFINHVIELYAVPHILDEHLERHMHH